MIRRSTILSTPICVSSIRLLEDMNFSSLLFKMMLNNLPKILVMAMPLKLDGSLHEPDL